MKHLFAQIACTCTCLLAFGGTLRAQPTPQAGQPAIQVEGQVDPSKKSTDVDRIVAYPMAQVVIAAKQAITMYRCFLKKEQPGYLECTRERNRGANGAGERVIVQLSATGSDTRVEIKTGREYWFQLPFGQQNWSTPIFVAMMSALELPPDVSPSVQISVTPRRSEPPVGTRVRVTAPGAVGKPRIGNILTVDEKTLSIVGEDGKRASFPREFVTRLDVSMGQKRQLVPGLLIGVAVGSVLGGLSPCYMDMCFTRGQGATAFGLGFGLAGAQLGWGMKRDKWMELPLDQVRVGLAPAPSGQGQVSRSPWLSSPRRHH